MGQSCLPCLDNFFFPFILRMSFKWIFFRTIHPPWFVLFWSISFLFCCNICYVLYFIQSGFFFFPAFVLSSYSFVHPNMIHIIIRNCYWLVCETMWFKLPLCEITWQSIGTSLTSGGSSFYSRIRDFSLM